MGMALPSGGRASVSEPVHTRAGASWPVVPSKGRELRALGKVVLTDGLGTGGTARPGNCRASEEAASGRGRGRRSPQGAQFRFQGFIPVMFSTGERWNC